MVNDAYFLWGAGTFGARMIEFMKNDLIFKSVIDSDSKKIGTTFHGLPVIGYEQAKKQLPKVKIVLAITYPNTICALLRQDGFIENKDFFTINDFIPRYYWEKSNMLICRTVSFGVTTHCTMKCDGCMAYVPFAQKRAHESKAEVLRNIDLLFNHLDKALLLNVTVGESLLNPDLADICTVIHQNYSSCYFEFLVQTNSTIIPSDNDMKKFAQADVIFVPSDYPENKSKTELFIKKCDEFNVKWHYGQNGKNRDTWFDFGNPDIENETDTKKLTERYARCFKPGMVLGGEHLYICYMQAWANLIVGIGKPIGDGDAFDLTKPKSPETREELYKILCRETPTRGYLEHCKRCYGTFMLIKE